MHSSQNWHIHYVHLSRNLHIHYVQISPAKKHLKSKGWDGELPYFSLFLAPFPYQVIKKSTWRVTIDSLFIVANAIVQCASLGDILRGGQSGKLVGKKIVALCPNFSWFWLCHSVVTLLPTFVIQLQRRWGIHGNWGPSFRLSVRPVLVFENFHKSHPHVRVTRNKTDFAKIKNSVCWVPDHSFRPFTT